MEDISYPTEEELERAVLVRASSSWGFYLRLQKSIRILTLGGSNTDYRVAGDKIRHYPEIVDAYIKAYVTSSSYVKNMGVGGADIMHYIHSPTFGFEAFPHDTWPNVISFEYSANRVCCSGEDDIKRKVQMMNIIREKYATHGVPEPSFLIIQIPLHQYMLRGEGTGTVKGGGLASGNLTARQKLIARAKDATSLEVLMSRFYWIPLISFHDATFPCFIRHFMAYNETVIWPLLFEDRQHLNSLGHKLLAEHVIIPFLRENMKPRAIDKKYSAQHPPPHPFGQHHNFVNMFETEVVREKPIERWALWGERENCMVKKKPSNCNFNTLFYPSEHWKVLELKPSRFCYSSSTLKSNTTMHFTVQKSCGKEYSCELRMEYLRSWNVTKIGDLICTLYRAGSHHQKHRTDVGANAAEAVLGTVRVEGNKLHNKDTTQHFSTLFNVTRGQYEVTCKKPDGRLSCIGSVVLMGIKAS